MKKYLRYLKEVLEHKKHVFKECCKEGLYLQAFLHDISKFSPKEFFAYAEWFCGTKTTEEEHKLAKENFLKAVEHHYDNNPHHWNYWIGQHMPYIYITEMVCDWKAVAKVKGGTAQEFYLKNYNKFELTQHTRFFLEFKLRLNKGTDSIFGKTLEEFSNILDEQTYNKFFGFINDEYKIDTYNLFAAIRNNDLISKNILTNVG